MTTNQTQASGVHGASSTAGHGAMHGRGRHAGAQADTGASGFLALLALAGAADEGQGAALTSSSSETESGTQAAGKGLPVASDGCAASPGFALFDPALLLQGAQAGAMVPADGELASAADDAAAAAVSASASLRTLGASAGVAVAATPASATGAEKPAPGARSALEALVAGLPATGAQAPDAKDLPAAAVAVAAPPAAVVQMSRDATSRLGWVESSTAMSTAGYLSTIGQAASAASLQERALNAPANAVQGQQALDAAKPAGSASARGSAAADARGAKMVNAVGETTLLAVTAAAVAAAAAADTASDAAGDKPADAQPQAFLTGLREAPQERPAGHLTAAAAADPAAPTPDSLRRSTEELVSQQVNYWLTQKNQSAELKVEGLGGQPVEVSISLSGNEAHVEFRSDHAEARELLGSTAPELADLLKSEGLVLGGVSVGTSAHGRSNGHQPTVPERGEARRSQRAPQEIAVAAAAPARLGSGNSGRALDLFV